MFGRAKRANWITVCVNPCSESTATVTLDRRVDTLNLPELPMTSKPTVYWLGAADGIEVGAELGTVDGRLD